MGFLSFAGGERLPRFVTGSKSSFSEADSGSFSAAFEGLRLRFLETGSKSSFSEADSGSFSAVFEDLRLRFLGAADVR